MEDAQISPNEGQVVYTSDGEELGRVKEVTATSFRIDAPLEFDYWLPNHTVETEEGGILRLGIAKVAIAMVKMDAPATES